MVLDKHYTNNFYSCGRTTDICMLFQMKPSLAIAKKIGLGVMKLLIEGDSNSFVWGGGLDRVGLIPNGGSTPILAPYFAATIVKW